MKTWLITGCSAGLGKQLAEAVAARGSMLRAVDSEDPPLHLPLGPSAHRIAERKLQAFHADIAAWRDISIATDFNNQS